MTHNVETAETSEAGALFDRLYAELHDLARSQRSRWHGEPTLRTTALVHEAYLRLADAPADFEGRSHFLGVAAKAMRCVLIDRARASSAAKRGGHGSDLPLDDAYAVGDGSGDDRLAELLTLDAALNRLAGADARAARVVECRFFGGMTLAETASALSVSVPTVSRAWAAAQAWLYQEVGDPAPPAPHDEVPVPTA